MKKRLVIITLFFSVIIFLTACTFYISEKKNNWDDTRAEQIIAVNEIEHLAMSGKLDVMQEKSQQLEQDIRQTKINYNQSSGIFIMCGICIVFLQCVFGYVFFQMLRPFEKMEEFAQKIASGNFNVPLNYERSNYFGAFTWAFDSMRVEITKARFCEREAIENNKTVIATLSHDIKTPIASIRAYAEALEANMDNSAEKREKYVSVIMKKCDEVSRLTNDLFLHSLSDLEKLKINPEKFELCCFIKNAVAEISSDHNDVHFKDTDFTAMIMGDKNRIIQITENLINNSRKYAGSDTDIFMESDNQYVHVHFRDYGSGIPDEDMPFIFDKFYRGKNCKNQLGSGLGLYIVKYITEQLGGTVKLQNHPDGLEVIISFPVIS